MAVSQEYLDFLTEGLESLGQITTRRMFGGAGIYCDGLIFAIVDDDQLYLKVDDESRPDFEQAGLGPFHYSTRDGKTNVMSYYRAPEDVLDDPEALCAWARRGLDAALRAKRR